MNTVNALKSVVVNNVKIISFFLVTNTSLTLLASSLSTIRSPCEPKNKIEKNAYATVILHDLQKQHQNVIAIMKEHGALKCEEANKEAILVAEHTQKLISYNKEVIAFQEIIKELEGDDEPIHDNDDEDWVIISQEDEIIMTSEGAEEISREEELMVSAIEQQKPPYVDLLSKQKLPPFMTDLNDVRKKNMSVFLLMIVATAGTVVYNLTQIDKVIVGTLAKKMDDFYEKNISTTSKDTASKTKAAPEAAEVVD